MRRILYNAIIKEIEINNRSIILKSDRYGDKIHIYYIDDSLNHNPYLCYYDIRNKYYGNTLMDTGPPYTKLSDIVDVSGAEFKFAIQEIIEEQDNQILIKEIIE